MRSTYRRSPATGRAARAAATALAGAALALATLGAPPTSAAQLPATSDACNQATLKALIVERNPELEAIWATWPTPETLPLDIICRKINGDTTPDALWLLNSGGTGGAFQAGIAESGLEGAPATITFWVDGYQLSTGLYKGKAAIAWPKHRKKDANCCATGGWRWRFYEPRADGTVRQSKLRKSTKKTYPLKRPKVKA